MMDAKYLAEIKAREQAATPGTWEMENEPKGSGFFGTIHGKGGISFSGNRADNEFIAHSRADVPALLAEVERLNAYESIDLLPEQIEAMQGHNIALIEENAAKDQQIAMLRKALEYACADHATTPSMWQDLQKKYMELAQQAQEQEDLNHA